MAAEGLESSDLFSSGGAPAPFDILSFVQTARKFWWIVAVFVFATLVLGVVYLKTAKPVYTATAEIKAERRSATSAISSSGAPIAIEGATTSEDLKTIEKSFISPMLMKRVAQELKNSGLRYSLGGYPSDQLSEDAVVGFLMQKCTVALVPDTRLLQISFQNSDPLVAQQIANTIMDQGIQYDADQRLAAVGANVRYLKEEVKKTEANLRMSDEKLNSYTRTLRNVSIDNELNIVANELRELNSRSTAAKADRLKVESDYSQIQSCLDDPDKLLSIESVQKVPAIVSLTAQIAEVKGTIAKLSQRYRPSNPFMVQAQSQLDGLQQSLKKELLQAPKSVEAALAGARRNEENILREQQAQEEKVIQVRELSVPSRVLQRQIDADRSTYESALKRLNEELSQARSNPVLIQVVNPAGPGIRTGYSPAKTMAAALGGGLALGFGCIVLIMRLDSSLKSAEEAEHAFGLSVLSAVPEYLSSKDLDPADGLPQDQRKMGWLNCPAVSDKHSTVAEAFRTLRTSLLSPLQEGRKNLILVTSPLDDEGKSFCCANFAAVLAQSGQRTLLVDANLRAPSLEKIIFDTPGRDGLSDYLDEDASLPSIIRSTPLANLDVVTAGTPCLHPTESLSRQKLLDFLDEATPLYDKIIVDSAPLTTVSDTLSFARFFPFICLVMRAARTPKGAAKRAIELLKRAGAESSGIIFNFAPATPFQSKLAEAEPPPQAEPQKSGVDQRDNSREGEFRRQVFGELLEHLEAAGLANDDARRHLMLTLKIWRSEISGDARLDNSEAGGRRNKMFSEMLDYLVKAGLPPGEARKKLLQAVESWRAAP